MMNILNTCINLISKIAECKTNTIVTPDLFYYHIVLPPNSRIYWTDSEIGVIRSCDENGGNLVTHVWALKEPWGLYIDPCGTYNAIVYQQPQTSISMMKEHDQYNV